MSWPFLYTRCPRTLRRCPGGPPLAVRPWLPVGVHRDRTRRHLEVRQWLEETYPAIEERAAQLEATIYWGDEVGVAADQQPARGYAPRGEAATMVVPDPHIRASQFSAISNTGKVHFMTYLGTLDAALFLTLLERLLRNTTGKVFLIVDQLRAHKTAEVASWVASHGDRLELFYLPRYAPELNADEYLNNDLKGQVSASGLPHSKAEVRSRIQDFMRKLLHLPEHVMSYFEHPSVQYAANMN